MVMMPARKMIARAILVAGRVAMMIGVIGLIVMHDVDGKNARAFMFVERHEGRAVLDLVGRLGRCHRGKEYHQRDAKRRDHTVQPG